MSLASDSENEGVEEEEDLVKERRRRKAGRAGTSVSQDLDGKSNAGALTRYVSEVLHIGKV